jgi:hypothetical protein
VRVEIVMSAKLRAQKSMRLLDFPAKIYVILAGVIKAIYRGRPRLENYASLSVVLQGYALTCIRVQHNTE